MCPKWFHFISNAEHWKIKIYIILFAEAFKSTARTLLMLQTLDLVQKKSWTAVLEEFSGWTKSAWVNFIFKTFIFPIEI